jgi:L-amino acid N-acyltransferase YncA
LKKDVIEYQIDFLILFFKNDNKEIIVYVYLDIFHERSAYRKAIDLSIYVSKNHLHQHMCKLLLDEISKLGKEQGFTNII